MKSILSHFFPACSGCYIVKNGDEVLYVGQSKNMRTRWMQHDRRNYIETNYPNATVEIVKCEVGDLLKKEDELIDELRPSLNVLYSYKGVRTGAIRPRFISLTKVYKPE